ncbi:DNA-formamidopyrimidine glycosylase [Cytobacillus suaedae]|nr:DNA-formamidopyrimidine glycosylase [Cytobacillus suaedae]
MPELPEMETYKNLLNQKLRGKVIKEVLINREKSINVPVPQFKSEVTGARIIEIERAAKQLIFHLDNGKYLLLHLMLGGLMYIGNEQDSPDRTKQIELIFEHNRLYFIGLRLGYLHLYNQTELGAELADLGPDPLSEQFTFQRFEELALSRKGMLKTTLVNQQFIEGIGNCYSDEICFHAKILPTRKFNELEGEDVKLLYTSIQSVLKEAIRLGGYMEMKLFESDLLTGGYNDNCMVYDRKGEPCPRCKEQIKKEMISSRKTFFCPNCQK